MADDVFDSATTKKVCIRHNLTRNALLDKKKMFMVYQLIILCCSCFQYNWNFKKFIERTPCARESLLYGIGAGMIAGFGCFMKTSELTQYFPDSFIFFNKIGKSPIRNDCENLYCLVLVCCNCSARFQVLSICSWWLCLDLFWKLVMCSLSYFHRVKHFKFL